MNNFLRTVREREVPYGSAVLWWLGQMGLLVKMGGTVLCVDYFASPDPGRRVASEIHFLCIGLSPNNYDQIGINL